MCTSRLTAFIKSLDPNHFISSGYGLPRQAAQHLRAQPQFSPQGADWTADDLQQFEQNIIDIHKGFDVMSNNITSGVAETDRFGKTDPNDAELITIIDRIAKKSGKILYIGEYGSKSSTFFSDNILDKVKEVKVPLSSPWILEFYQFNTFTPAPFNIEPGYSDYFIRKYEAVSQAFGTSVIPESSTPQVVLTWPVANARLASNQKVYVVASAARNIAILRVEFLVDGVKQATIMAPPYCINLDTQYLTSGIHTLTLTAIAYSTDGRQSSYSTSVVK